MCGGKCTERNKAEEKNEGMTGECCNFKWVEGNPQWVDISAKPLSS